MELNEKLARWAGFFSFTKAESNFDFGIAPNGKISSANFTSSLDACFKWLVPKLDTWVIRNYVPQVGTYHKPRAEVLYRDSNLKWYRGKAEEGTPALALCKAIEQLIDKETNGS